MKADGRLARLLGLQAPLHGAQAQVALAHRLEIGLGRRIVELHQQLAFLDLVAFADKHFLDDAAAQVLDRLALGVDGYMPLAGHAFVQRSQCGPQQKTAKADAKCPQADSPGMAQVRRGFLVGAGFSHERGRSGSGRAIQGVGCCHVRFW